MTTFRNLNLTAKLILGFATVLILTIFLGVFSLLKLAAVRATTVEMADHRLLSIRVLGDIKVQALNMRRGQLQIAFAKNDRDSDWAAGLQRIEAAQKEFAADQAKYVPTINNPEEQKLYDSIVAIYGEFRKTDPEVARLYQQGKQAAALEYIKTVQRGCYEMLAGAVDAELTFNDRAADKANKVSEGVYLGARLWVWGVLGCSVAVGMLLALFIARLIGLPVQEAAEVARQVAAGDLTGREIEVRSTDEMGLLGRSINEMQSSIRKTIDAISHNAQQLASSSEELSAVSAQMGANSEETSTQSNVVAAAAEQVSKSIQTVATGTEEMMASIKEIAKNSSDAARVATQAVRVAETTNNTVGKLGESSNEIGQVIKVITSIAQQTNLLALNATIEAARAGEAGKGFAVVANEVKELAKETAKATEDISRKIEAIQTDTQDAVTAIGEISGIIRQINDIQNTIASAVEEQSATTNEIGRNITEAAKGSTEIAQNIGGVAHAAKSTAEGACNSQAAAAELARMASELQTLVGQFKLEGSATNALGRGANRGPANLRVVSRRAA